MGAKQSFAELSRLHSTSLPNEALVVSWNRSRRCGCRPGDWIGRGCGWWERHGAAPDQETTHDQDHPPTRAPTRWQQRYRNLAIRNCCRALARAGSWEEQDRGGHRTAATRGRRDTRGDRSSNRLAKAHDPRLADWPQEKGYAIERTKRDDATCYHIVSKA